MNQRRLSPASEHSEPKLLLDHTVSARSYLGFRILNVPIGNAPDNLTPSMIEKIDSKKGREIYPQRIAVVEPVFANVRTHKMKVSIQWLLYCMIHNIEKIVHYGVNYGVA